MRRGETQFIGLRWTEAIRRSSLLVSEVRTGHLEWTRRPFPLFLLRLAERLRKPVVILGGSGIEVRGISLRTVLMGSAVIGVGAPVVGIDLVSLESRRKDFRVTGAVEGMEIAKVEGVEPFGTGFAGRDEVEVIVDRTTAHAARFGFTEGCQ